MRAKKNTLSLGELPGCETCPARLVGVCAGVDRNGLNELEAVKIYRRYAPGERILLAGRKPGEVATVLTGMATMSRTQERGTRQIVSLIQPGDLIGQHWQSANAFDVEALTHVETCAIKADSFEALLEAVPGLQARLMTMVLADLDAARSWLGVLGRKTARQKLAGLMVVLAMRQNTAPLNSGGCRLDMILSREQLADLLSMTFETVSRQITGLVRDGLLVPRSRRVFDVPDLQALMMASGDDADGGPYQA